MKKTSLLLMFFYVSSLCCFADENIEAPPLFPFSGLSVPTLLSTDNTLVWKQADWGLTEYSEGGPYKPNHFLVQCVLMIGGLVMFFGGVGVLVTGDSNSVGLSAPLMIGGVGAYAGGLLWMILE